MLREVGTSVVAAALLAEVGVEVGLWNMGKWGIYSHSQAAAQCSHGAGNKPVCHIL